MELINFTEVNVVIAKDQPEYLPMPAHIAHDQCNTTTICWNLSLKERLVLLFTGKLWHQILLFRNNMQPMMLMVRKPKL